MRPCFLPSPLTPTTMVLRMLKTAAAWATRPCFRVALRKEVGFVREGSDFFTSLSVLATVCDFFPAYPFMYVKLHLLGTWTWVSRMLQSCSHELADHACKPSTQEVEAEGS